jgi:hypothetical protein
MLTRCREDLKKADKELTASFVSKIDTSEVKRSDILFLNRAILEFEIRVLRESRKANKIY